jgi:hypothetical protein
LANRPAEQRHEDAAEALALDEASSAVGERLEQEAVLAVEESGHEQAPEPAKLSPRQGSRHGRPERHRLSAGRRDPHLELRAFAKLARSAGFRSRTAARSSGHSASTRTTPPSSHGTGDESSTCSRRLPGPSASAG